MGNIQFYEMALAEDGVTMRPKVDDDGNKIPTKGANMSVLALKHPANGRSDRVYLIDEVNTFAGSAVATNYEMMVKDKTGLMVGNVVNDARNNPELKTNINNQVAAMTSTITQASSILSEDNGIGVKYIPFNQYESDAYWKQLGEDKNATITIDILDENLEVAQVEVPKYVKVGPTSNNSITAHFPPDGKHMEAVQGYTRKSLVSGLQKKITKGTKVTQFDPNTASKTSNKSAIDKGVRTVATLNSLRGAKTVEDMELALQELQGLSGLSYESIDEKVQTIQVPDGQGGFKNEEIVTSVTLDLGGKLIEMEFGKVVEDPDNKGNMIFKPTNAEDFINANYRYINPEGVSSDIANKNFRSQGNTYIEEVGQPGEGSRKKSYKETKNVTLAGEYNLGGSKTSLSTQLRNAFDKADKASAEVAGIGANNDVNSLASGIEAAIGSAYDASGLSVPKGFDVTASGGDVIISAIDSEGIKVTETLKDIDEAVSNAGPGLVEGAVQSFLNKMNQ
jgi:hypothetical protein